MIIYNHIYICIYIYIQMCIFMWLDPVGKLILKTLSSLFRDRIHHIRQVDNLILSINSLSAVLQINLTGCCLERCHYSM